MLINPKKTIFRGIVLFNLAIFTVYGQSIINYREMIQLLYKAKTQFLILSQLKNS